MDSLNHTTAPCFLYLVQVASGPVKIGIAIDVQNRLDTLQTANYEDLRVVYTFKCASVEQSQSLESLLHHRYRAQHIRGEWYAVDPNDIVADIEFAIRFSELFQSVEVNRYKHILTRPATKAEQERIQSQGEAVTKAKKWLAANPDKAGLPLRQLEDLIGVGKDSIAKARKEMAERGGA